MFLNFKNEFINRFCNSFKLGLYYGLLFGILVGISRCLIFIQQNNYTPDNLKKVVVYLFKFSINKNVLIFSLILIIFLILIEYVKIARKAIFPSIITLLIFTLGGYYFNKNVFPGFYEIKSIVGNAVLFIVSLSVGLVILKRIKFEINSPKVRRFYNQKLFVLLIVIFLIFNILVYITATNNSFINTSKTVPDKKFINLFNLDYPGLEHIKQLNKQGNNKDAKSALLDYFRIKKTDSSLVDFEEINQLDSAQVIFAAKEILDHKFKNVGKTYYLGEQIDWTKNPDVNNEWIWKLNSHRQFHRLGWAYHKTGDEKYAKEFNDLIFNWIVQNPPQKWKNEKSFTWRLMDVGERMYVSWIKLYYIFKSSDSFKDETLKLMLASIYNHAQFLKLFKSPTRNHLLMESRGLAYVSTYFPEFKLAKEWEDIAYERVENAIETEINDDGSYCELSTGYQWLVIRQFEGFLDLERKNGRSLNGKEKIIKMYEFLMNVMRPDGELPEINDGFPPENFNLILTEAAEKYNRGDFLYAGTFGKQGTKPAYTPCQLPDAGYYVMRTDWSANANYFIFDGGPYGSAHGHDDKLGFECSAFGKTMICDVGTYTSDASNKYVDYFHRSTGHNTIVVDGKSQSRFYDKNLWIYNSSYSNENIWKSNTKYDYIQGEYSNGYGNYKEKIDRSVKHIRKIVFIKPEYWVVSDLLLTDGEHSYEQFFHFVPTELSVNGKKVISTQNRQEANLAIFPLNPDQLDLKILEGSDDPIQGWVSKGYNRKEPAPAVIYSKRSKGSTSFNTVLYPFPEDVKMRKMKLEKVAVELHGHELPETEAICLKFENGKWTDYIMISHQKVGSKAFHKFVSDGDVAYLRENDNGDIVESFEINLK